MSRFHFFLAARAPSDLDALPNSQINASWGNGNGPELRWRPWTDPQDAYPERTALVREVATVTIPGKTLTWRLYQISPLSNDPAVARRLFRRLRREALAQPRLAGPWGPAALRRLSAALADAHASVEGPLVEVSLPGGGTTMARSGGMPLLAGDDAARSIAYDYDPSDADCTADVDAT